MSVLIKYTEAFEDYFGLSSGTVIRTAIPVSVALVVGSHLLLRSRKRQTVTTPLNSPKGKSYILGLIGDLSELPALSLLYEKCEKMYGSVFAVPGPMGSKAVVLCDPKAVAHFFSKDTETYRQPPNMRFVLGL
ncbi:hypothetical protein H0H92_002338, partial [Tricholoma furcatifolium]